MTLANLEQIIQEFQSKRAYLLNLLEDPDLHDYKRMIIVEQLDFDDDYNTIMTRYTTETKEVSHETN